MRSTARRAAATLTAAGLCLGAGTASGDRIWSRDEREEAWRSYVSNVEAALGTFDDVTVYQRLADRWKLVTGKFVPVTVDGAPPDAYASHMAVDRPMLLPPDILAPGTGEGGGVPYSVVGRMAGSNPEVQWVFLSRHYYVSDPSRIENTGRCDSFICLNDVAVIGHHPRTGATAYFQFYDTQYPKPAPTIVSPWSASGAAFWNDVTWLADINCAKCHSADPFIHSPWISQVTVDLQPGQSIPETMVPSNPLGPYFIIGAEVGGKNIFDMQHETRDEQGRPVTVEQSWNIYLKHLADPEIGCTTCHRIPEADNDLANAVKLYARSTLGIGVAEPKSGGAGYAPDANQTAAYQMLPWMPPVDLAYGDFYAGQRDAYCIDEPCGQNDLKATAEIIRKGYEQLYGDDARTVNELSYGAAERRQALRDKLQDVPAPPQRHRSIVVERDGRDALDPNAQLLVLDTRMRANADTSLRHWRFHADNRADADLRATPVVLRRAETYPDAGEFEILSVGTPRDASFGGQWAPVSDLGDVAISQGQYMGLLLSNGGAAPRPALVPYSDDEDWAKPVNEAGATAFPFAIVTYTISLDREPVSGERVRLGAAGLGYRTYSFEFRSRE
jgi:hypothetical protein